MGNEGEGIIGDDTPITAMNNLIGRLKIIEIDVTQLGHCLVLIC